MDAVDDVERTREDGHGQQREKEWNLVSCQLCSGADTADEGVLVVGRPASEEHANGRDAKDGDGVEDGEVRIGSVNAA